MNRNGFKNKSDRNAGYVTAAMQIFKDKQLLNERPENMDPLTYRILRKMQSDTIKYLFHKGKSPSRKLNGIMGIKQPNVRFNAPKRKINTPRKTS